MSSPDVPAAPAGEPEGRHGAGAADGTLRALLDVAFGFFVWAAHFLAVYIAAAVSCQLGLGAAGAGTRPTFPTVLAIVTMATAALVVLHAVRRWRRQHGVPDQRFRMAVTIGNDAIATVAIVWQLFAIALVPPCV